MLSEMPLIEGIGQFLDGVFASCDLHNRHTRNLADAASEFLIVCSDSIDTVLRYLYNPVLATYKTRNLSVQS